MYVYIQRERERERGRERYFIQYLRDGLRCDVRRVISSSLRPGDGDESLIRLCACLIRDYCSAWLTQLVNTSFKMLSSICEGFRRYQIYTQSHNRSPLQSVAVAITDVDLVRQFHIYYIQKTLLLQLLVQLGTRTTRSNKSSCFCIPDSRAKASLLSLYKKNAIPQHVSEGGMQGLFSV